MEVERPKPNLPEDEPSTQRRVRWGLIAVAAWFALVIAVGHGFLFDLTAWAIGLLLFLALAVWLCKALSRAFCPRS